MKQIVLTRHEFVRRLQEAAADPFTTTPAAITDKIKELCKRLNNGTPVYVPVEPEANAPLNDCFNVVRRCIERDGGSIEYGWTIWEWPTIMIEAEHHAVWIPPGGRRIDIAPKQHGERRMLFVPDASAPFNGQRRNNRRMPLRKHPAVSDFIGISSEIHRVMGPSVGPFRVTRELMELERIRGSL